MLVCGFYILSTVAILACRLLKECLCVVEANLQHIKAFFVVTAHVSNH